MFTLTNQHTKAETHYYPELGEFLADITPAKLAKAHHGSVVLNEGAETWSGGVAYAQAHESCGQGVTFDARTFELRDRLVTKIAVATAQTSFLDVTGSGDIDMGAYLSGEPECIMTFREDVGKNRRVISLIMSLDAFGSQSAEGLRLRGAANMALIDALEMSGQYKINVYGSVGSRGRYGNNLDLIIRLKEAGRSYDPQAIGYAMASPAFLRKLVFGYFDLLPRATQERCRMGGGLGYGCPAQVPNLPDEVDMGSVDLSQPIYGGAFYNEEGAYKWVESMLEKYSVAMNSTSV